MPSDAFPCGFLVVQSCAKRGHPLLILFYTFIQTILLIFGWPLLLLLAIFKSHLRTKIARKCGIGLADQLPAARRDKTFWLHALSVGELTSSLPLLEGIRKSFPQSTIIVTVSTTSGEQLARRLLAGLADCISFGPLDYLPIINYFIRCIQPDIYILVETDFWPALLHRLASQNIPTLLVNGRISVKSMARYQRFRLFTTPMFQSFRAMALQNTADKDSLIQLGISEHRLHILGNLKYDCNPPQSTQGQQIIRYIPAGCRVILAGSTHPGEEEPLISSYRLLKETFPDLFLIIAPRHPQRAEEIRAIATREQLKTALRSGKPEPAANLLILDTLGELASTYALADIAFVGGSLVPAGGHNPLEPAACGVPVLFGPHMEDFPEISEALIAVGAAQTVTGASIDAILRELVVSDIKRQEAGTAAYNWVKNQRGVVARHLDLIRTLM